MSEEPPDGMEHVEAGGARIPALGLGTWQNTGESCTESVRTALDLGYRHIDTAEAYGNEPEVGAGIAQADIDREDVFLTTKVWRSNLRSGDLADAVEASLERLDVEYVDLLLAHWPHRRVPIAETVGAMEDLREEGLVEHVGVSNYTAGHLETAVEAAEGPIVADQVLYNPLKDQSDLLAVCRERDVALTAYSPLTRGDVLEDDLLAKIGDGYGKSAAQVALRWLVQQDSVVTVPKATSRDHIEANLAIFDFELDEDEMDRIHEHRPGLLRRLKNYAPAFVRNLPL